MAQPHYEWVRSREEQARRDFLAKHTRMLRKINPKHARLCWKIGKQFERDLYNAYMGRAEA